MPSPPPEAAPEPTSESITQPAPERARSRSPPRGPRGSDFARRRSRSPRNSDEPRRRSRSRSPGRSRPKNYSGLKWKRQNTRGDDEYDLNRGSGTRDDRWKPRNRDDRFDQGRGQGRGGRDSGFGRRDDRDRDSGYGRRDDRDRDRGYGGRGSGRDHGDDRYGRNDDRNRDDRRNRDRDERKPKAPKPTIPVLGGGGGEQMIIVTVNDRLGTKAQIPCLASDSVKVFKAMVAARIGRAPHEIQLKRQGERAFKDQLSLEDYGVSNGVQLDLELDSGA